MMHLMLSAPALWTEWLTDRHLWKHYFPVTSLADSNNYCKLHSLINTKRHHHTQFLFNLTGRPDDASAVTSHKSWIRYCCRLRGHTVENCGYFKMYFLVAGPCECLIRVRLYWGKRKRKQKCFRNTSGSVCIWVWVWTAEWQFGDKKVAKLPFRCSTDFSWMAELHTECTKQKRKWKRHRFQMGSRRIQFNVHIEQKGRARKNSFSFLLSLSVNEL